MAAADYRLMTEATGQRIAAALEALSGFGSYLTTADVVNNLTSGGTTVPLSAEMGKELNDKLSNIMTISGTTTADGLIKLGDMHSWDTVVTCISYREGIALLYTDSNGNFYAKILDYNLVKKASTSVSFIVRYIQIL